MSALGRAKRGAQRLVRRAGFEIHRAPGLREDDRRYAGYDRATLRRRPFLNVGAGAFRHRHWTNVDYDSEWYAGAQPAGFVHFDLTALEPLPFEAGQIELAYTSHVIEHVPDPAAANLFRECHRVLQPGGGLRVTCPDARLLYRSVADGRVGYWRWREPWFSGPMSRRAAGEDVSLYDYLVREVATPRCRHYAHALERWSPDDVARAMRELPYAEFLDHLVRGLEFRSGYPGDHINWWDEAKVRAQLEEAGFQTVYVSRRGQSLFPPMTDPTLFDSTMPANSLYVEAVR